MNNVTFKKVKQKNTPYKGFKKKDWALKYIEVFGAISGTHHKDWVIDQVARILNGTPMVITKVEGDDIRGGVEYSFSTGKPSKKYLKWVKTITDGDIESYDEGIAP